MDRDRDCNVAVIGAGPCGLMLAIELGRRGVRTVVLEEKTSPQRFPAANATQARTMEHYRRLGFAERVRAEGLPDDYPTDIAYFTRYSRHELARIRLPSKRTAREMVRSLTGSWSAAELPHRCSQMYIEEVLRAEAEALPEVSIRTGLRATALRQDETGVTIEIEPVADMPSTRTLRADYAVGADGARSLVRRTLGASLTGEGGAVRDFLGGRMFAMHFRAPALYDAIAHPQAWMYWSVAQGARSILASINGRDEFAYHAQLRPDQDADAISDSDARSMLEASLGAPIAIDILARSRWNAGYTLVADRLGHGRLAIGGDAAHLFTPTGGLGYNTAVEDAVNLGWKLAALVHGWGGPVLLPSYETERQAVARRNTAFARGFADSVGGFVPPPELEADGAAGAAARAVAARHFDHHARFEFDIPGITFGGRYDGSPIVVSDGTPPPPDRPNEYTPTACPGGRAPHLWLGDGRSLFDALGFDFTLLRLGPSPPDAAPFRAAADALGVPLTVLDLSSEQARDLYGAELALIRPDQIVAWRGPSAANAEAAVRQAAGWGTIAKSQA